MERHPYTTLDDGLIALIVKNLDHQVEIRGGRIHDDIATDEPDDLVEPDESVEFLGPVEPVESVDLIVDVTINLAKGTMKFLFASKVSYDVEYAFTRLESDKVLKLLTSSNVLFFGTLDMIRAQLERGGFSRTLLYSDKVDLRQVHRVTARR